MNNVIAIKLLDKDIYIVTVYRPPSYTAEENRRLADYLKDFCSSKEVIVQGDFNLPSLQWCADDPAERYVTPLDMSFLEIFISAGLTQVVKEPTHFPSENTIDLCLLSHSERLGSISVEPPLPACKHGVVIINYTFQVQKPQARQQPKKIWTKGNYDCISRGLADTDWDSEFLGLNTQEMYDKFLAITKALTDRYIPSCSDRMGKPPWTLNPPRDMIRLRAAAFRRYKETRTLMGRRHPTTFEAWRSFTEANDRMKNFAVNSQKEYEKNIAQQIKTSPKLFHSYMRHRRVGRPSIGPLKIDDDSVTDDPTLMAKQFASSFLEVFSGVTPQNPSEHQVVNASIAEVYVTPENVEQEIKTLDANSAMGSDGVHPRLLSRCAAALRTPLSLIFNRSLQEGSLPAQWLLSTITPIFKRKGVRTEALNYRPVAVTSVPCKVLEKVIVNRLKPYLANNHILSNHQFGFRSGFSTVDQLTMCYDYVTRNVDDGKMVDMIFFDFSKAFDTVNHSIMELKLEAIGICSQLTSWIREFLVARVMQVRVMDGVNNQHQVSSGVPQGSVLGPILFLIYVNHVVNELRCEYKIFADDIKLYITSNPMDPTSGDDSLQGDVNRLVETAGSWGLTMNVTKCICLRFGPRSLGDCNTGPSPYKIGTRILKFSPSHKDLGVKIDRKLKFHEHIRTTANLCNAITNNIFCSTLCRDPDFLMNIYKSLVRPKLEYGSQIWNLGYLGDLRLLERVQRKWTKRVNGLGELPYAERLKQLDLYSIQGRLLRADLIQTWKILNGECGADESELFVLDNSSRRGHSRKLYLPRANLEVRRRFFSVRVIGDWNSLKEDTVSAPTINRFKSLLHRDLGQRLYNHVE